MTYLEFEQAYDAGKFTPTTPLGVKLIYQTYTPDRFHKLADLSGVVLSATSALTWKQFTENGMGWILDKVKARAKTYVTANQDKVAAWVEKFPNREVLEQAFKPDTFDLKDTGVKWAVVYCPSLGINCFCEELP